MNKVKIIIVNLILFFILFHVVDFYCTITDNKYDWFYKDYKGIKLIKYIKSYNQIHRYSIIFDAKANNKILSNKYSNHQVSMPNKGEYRPIENINAKNSIIIFGCSFTSGDVLHYSTKLSNNETFSYQLGRYLPNYTVYNRAQSGWSTSQMLYQLENKDFKEIKNLKYVIYVFMNDHYCRNNNYHFCVSISPYYKMSKKGLCFEKYSTKYIICPIMIIIREIYTNKLAKGKLNKKTNKIKRHIIMSIKKNNVNLTKNIILSSKEILDNKHSGTKFIILRYDNGKNQYSNKMFEEIKKEGVIVLQLNDLSNKDFITLPYQISKNDKHPNSKAWLEITPLFVKYLQDKGYLMD